MGAWALRQWDAVRRDLTWRNVQPNLEWDIVRPILTLVALAGLTMASFRVLMLGPEASVTSGTIRIGGQSFSIAIAVIVAAVLILGIALSVSFGRTILAFAPLTFAVGVACLFLPADPGHLAIEIIVIIVAWVGLLFVVSAEFSTTFLRCITALFIVAVLCLVGKAGRDNRLVAAQATVGHLQQSLASATAEGRAMRYQAVFDTETAAAALRTAGAAAAPKAASTTTTTTTTTAAAPAAVQVETVGVDALKVASDLAGDLDHAPEARRSIQQAAADLGMLEFDAGGITPSDVSAKALTDLATNALTAAQKIVTLDNQVREPLQAAAADIMKLDKLARSGAKAADCTNLSRSDGHGAPGFEVDDVAFDEAQAQRDIAAYRLAISQSDSNKSEFTESEMAASNAILEPCGTDTDVLTLMDRGANAVVSGIPGLRDSRLPLAAGLIGWTLLGLLTLAGYRRLEVRSARDQIGPVTVDPPDNDADKTKTAAIRTYILQNLPEPSTMPGADALVPMTNLLSAASTEAGSTAPALTFIATALTSLVTFLSPKSGYSVAIEINPGLANGASSQVAALVRIRDTQTSASLYTGVVYASTEDELLRAAGYRASAWILGRSRVTPKWALWSEDSSTALGAYLEGSQDSQPIEPLELAVKSAPRSGLLCTLLANRYDLDGKYAHALEFYLRAAAIYPRFYPARYRIGISFGLISEDVSAHWLSVDLETRERIVDSYNRFRLGRGGSPLSGPLGSVLTTSVDPDEIKQELVIHGVEEQHHIKKFHRFFRLGTLALRRSERRFWVGWATPGATGRANRRRHKEIVDACLLVGKFRLGGDHKKGAASEAVRIKKQVDRANSWWHVAYNLACYDAVLATDATRTIGERVASRRSAIELLETAVEHPGGWQMKKEWVASDPDLLSLKDEDRFTQFVKALPSDKDR